MGYDTRFEGWFNLSRPLTVPQFNQLKAFADERHEGKEYPGYYCQWVPTQDGQGLEWDGGEKFYEYVAWLQYLIDRFFKHWGITLSGEVKWKGQDFDDVGIISVQDNVVSTRDLVAINIESKNELLDRFLAVFCSKLKSEIDVLEDEYREGFESASRATIEQLKEEGLL